MIAANNATQNRINCVKNLANAGSLQNAVGLGNAKGVKGWLAGAHPEHAVLGSVFGGGGSISGVTNGTGQALGSNAAVAGGKAVASRFRMSCP